MLQARFGAPGDAVLDLFRDRGYRMFALNDDRLEERTTLVEACPGRTTSSSTPARPPNSPTASSRPGWQRSERLQIGPFRL
jgi:hypothetical protein